MDSEWLNHPAMQNVSPEKKGILLDFMKEADGISMDKAMPLFVKTNSRLKALGLTFTKEESELITEILTKNLTPAEKMKMETLKKLIPKK